jgi:tetratricopeptide (TPR) repeat protein
MGSKTTRRASKSSPPKRKRSSSKSAANARKGKIVEAVVALMHDYSGVKVERNVRLPPVHGDQSRRREIDVLLTGYVAGYPVRIAFQCKNERKPIEPELIDAFIGELDDVGIPPQHGIFVCVNGYTRGALDRAKSKGIRTLVLKGLTKDRLASEVAEAFQFNVYLLAEVTGITIRNEVSKQEYEGQFLLFFDDKKRICGLLPDLIVSRWQYGDPPSTLGEYTLNLDVPQGWNQIVADKIEPVLAISARVRVRGMVITLSGKTESHALVDPVTEGIAREHVNVQFDLPPKGKKVVYPVTSIDTEEELKKFTEKRGSVRVVMRIRLPRIRCGNVYHPLSERVARLLFEEMKKFEEGETPDPRSISFADLEGTDLSAAWEAPWYGLTKNGAPVLATDDEGNSVDVRMLIDAGEFGRVVALRPQFERNPTPEFAYLLSWAYLTQGDVLRRKAKAKEGDEARRLIQQGVEKIESAITVSPQMPEGFINLGGALRELGRFEEAVAAYDRALSITEDDHETWGNRAVPLINQNKFDEALESVNKSLTYAREPGQQSYALSMRASVHHFAGRHTDAATDLFAAWKLDADAVVENINFHPFIEAICVAAPSPEGILLLAEAYWSKAADESVKGAQGECQKWAEQGTAALESLVPDDGSGALQVGSVSNQLVYDVLTRAAGRLKKTGVRGLVNEHVRRMQSWASLMLGEPLDELAGLLSDLPDS